MGTVSSTHEEGGNGTMMTWYDGPGGPKYAESKNHEDLEMTQ